MSESNPAVSVIIPVFNQWRLTRGCLAALAENREGTDLEVLVVDNGSTDKTPENCPSLGRALFGEAFKYVSPGRNLNFGPGCNLGAETASGGLLFFLNNDTIPARGWLGPLLAAIRSGAGAAGPLLLFPGVNSVQHLGVTFHVGLEASHLHSHIPGNHALAKKRRDLQAITGAALMIPRGLFADIGGFYPEYQNGCEDLELCRRVRERGLKVVCEPDSVILHAAGQSLGRGLAEEHNFRLLKSRCADGFRPDFQDFARRDGYGLRLSELCDLYMAVPEDRSKAHLAEVGDFNEARCREILDREIYWEEGYDFLAERLEAGGAEREAMLARYEQSLYFERKEHLLKFMRLARRTRDFEALAHAERALSMIQADENDESRLRAKAEAGLAHYRKAGDQELAGLYERWIKEHQGPRP